jgi:GrpB-like predicted nucleotidyltransferase (UPF0157 family)
VSTIEPYQREDAVCREYDEACVRAASATANLIRARLPAVRVEHIGSTAIPGCAGKGIVDLMVLYPTGQLEDTRAGLDALGFQRQQGTDPFPESRPMRVGTVRLEGRPFRLHVHVIAGDDGEATRLLRFRDRLRADPELRAAYVDRKGEILAAGVRDPEAYAEAKGDFVARVLAPHRQS